MRASLIALALIAATTTTASAARERAIPVGPYSGRCGDDVQCKVEMLKTAGGYKMKLLVADGLDITETVCAFDVDMISLAHDVAATSDKSVRVVLLRTGELVVSGLPNDECSGAVVNGSYVEYHDE